MSNTAKTIIGIIVVIVIIIIIAVAVKPHDDTVVTPAQTDTATQTSDTAGMQTTPASGVTSSTSVDSDLGNIDTQMTGLQSDTASASTTTQ